MSVITDFTTGQSDEIDISGLILGYTPGVSILSNFVQAANDGSGGSYLQVDANGTGSNFKNVIDIQGNTSINVSTWVSNGNLVV